MDAAAVQVEAGQPVIVQPVGGRIRWKYLLPHAPALRRSREWEVDDEAQAAREGRVEGALHVGGENCQAPVGFHTLQQVVDLDVGVAVMAVLDLAAFAEKGIRFVKEEDGPPALGSVEEAA